MTNRGCVVVVAIVLFSTAVLDAATEQGDSRRPPLLNFVGVTGHAWGMWVGSGVAVEEWIEEARRYCESEEYCEVNVFEGAEFATHEYPVPDENRKALKWVFVYRQNETPRIVVEEVHPDQARESRRWIIDK